MDARNARAVVDQELIRQAITNKVESVFGEAEGKVQRPCPGCCERLGAATCVACDVEAQRIVLTGDGRDVLLQRSTARQVCGVEAEIAAERVELDHGAVRDPASEVAGLEATIDGQARTRVFGDRAEGDGRSDLRRLVRTGDVERQGRRSAVTEIVGDREVEQVGGMLAIGQPVERRIGGVEIGAVVEDGERAVSAGDVQDAGDGMPVDIGHAQALPIRRCYRRDR